MDMEKHIKKPFKLRIRVDPDIDVLIGASDPVDCITLAHRCMDVLIEGGFEPHLDLVEIEESWENPEATGKMGSD